MTDFGPTHDQPEEAKPDAPRVAYSTEDIRGRTTSRRDQSEHRRFAWLYEDLLA
ncbi:hypothetical protein LR948_16140 [Roseivivax sp. GX 12232]|uniref:hypothetical protein n=1 Tax=Roseivivax sp. GX 12232 TaxID=2900547 RepID=UPI001E3414DE|nr:hypothetical protein [Roseivivax sp. GX 12232]MCE0506902.1 hypothetical protein [Roseivivax sp. GX 12232]